MTSAVFFSSHNRGPLTTTFTPPASCLSTTTSSASEGSSTALWVGHSNTEGDTACYPTATTSITTPVNGYYYSPGLCPSGYYSACSLTTLLGIGTIPASKTGAACCPINFSCMDHINCGISFPENTTISNVYVLTNTPWSSIGFPNTISVGDVPVTISQIVAAEIIPVLWESTDTEVLVAMGLLTTSFSSSTSTPTSASASTSSPASTSVSASTSRATPPPTPTSDGSSSGLSTGARIGIGVGVGVGALALILGVFLFFRRHQRQKKGYPRPYAGYAPFSTSPALHELPEDRSPYFPNQQVPYVESYAMPQLAYAKPVELSSHEAFELAAEIPPPAELPSAHSLRPGSTASRSTTRNPADSPTLPSSVSPLSTPATPGTFHRYSVISSDEGHQGPEPS